jgi:hypothetical protein
MAYQRRAGNGQIQTLGDGPGQIQEIEGTLTGVRASTQYPDNKLFDILTAARETVTIAGCAGLNARLDEEDIAQRVLITYGGEGRTKKGTTFKIIEVLVDVEEPAPEPAPRPPLMPRGDEPVPPPDRPPEADDDDLPF